jgi:hypothetical protein
MPQPKVCSARFAYEPQRCANRNDMTIPLITNELDVPETRVRLADMRIIEACCGAARFIRPMHVRLLRKNC